MKRLALKNIETPSKPIVRALWLPMEGRQAPNAPPFAFTPALKETSAHDEDLYVAMKRLAIQKVRILSKPVMRARRLQMEPHSPLVLHCYPCQLEEMEVFL